MRSLDVMDEDALVHVVGELFLAHVALDGLGWARPRHTTSRPLERWAGQVHPPPSAHAHADVETLGHQVEAQLLFLLLRCLCQGLR